MLAPECAGAAARHTGGTAGGNAYPAADRVLVVVRRAAFPVGGDAHAFWVHARQPARRARQPCRCVRPRPRQSPRRAAAPVASDGGRQCVHPLRVHLRRTRQRALVGRVVQLDAHGDHPRWRQLGKRRAMAGSAVSSPSSQCQSKPVGTTMLPRGPAMPTHWPTVARAAQSVAGPRRAGRLRCQLARSGVKARRGGVVAQRGARAVEHGAAILQRGQGGAVLSGRWKDELRWSSNPALTNPPARGRPGQPHKAGADLVRHHLGGGGPARGGGCARWQEGAVAARGRGAFMA